MKKSFLHHSLLFLITSALLAMISFPALAQEDDELRLNINKVFGYSSGFGSGNIKLQGTMRLTARGPQDLQRVVFFMDDTSMGEVSQAPFRLNFTTDSYPLEKHTLYALGYTAGGSELKSNLINVEFVSAEEGWQDALRIIGPLFAVIFGVMVIATVGPLVLGRGKTSFVPLGTERNYGVSGGTICPKCKRPYAMHFYGLNMLTHKLDLCPHCRRWSLVRRLPIAELRAAERAELEMAPETTQVSTTTEEEKLRKELEDSRFDRT